MVTKQQSLEEALAKAEAVLHTTVARLAKQSGDRGDASDSLDKARANCRQAHAALTAFKNSRNWIDRQETPDLSGTISLSTSLS
jgi:hypothetical protein